MQSGELVGKQITIGVSEPWGFSACDGSCKLVGHILEQSADDEAMPWLICRVTPFLYGQVRISEVLATRRDSGCSGLFEALLEHGSVSCNIAFDFMGQTLAGTRIGEIREQRAQEGTGEPGWWGLIGTVYLQG